MEHSGHHFVAIFGGAVAGSEAAYQLASRGFRVVVFDQNILPYGKIEDGLPKWHHKLRDKEEKKIDEKLNHPGIRYVPNVALGREIDFDDIVNHWGFTAVLLATGAWKDRPLPIEGIDQYIDKGLYYQNPFVYWFNHKHEPNYSGRSFAIRDGAIVIGGGLASLDVVKILMIETVQKALDEKGHHVDMFTLERSISKVLDDLGLTLSDLGLKGCTLFYRRRDEDMPLSPMATDTPEQLEKAKIVRKKILENFKKKYLFNFEPLHIPVGVVAEGTLKGITFQRAAIENGLISPIPDSKQTYYAPLVISSIGSIPEPIRGIPHEGQVFKVNEDHCCQIEGYENVFALGNAVTGRGNINESAKHGKEMAIKIMDSHLDWQENDYQQWLRGTEDNIRDQVDTIARHIERQKFMPDEVICSIIKKTETLQRNTGYDGNYEHWVDKHLPVRLESMLSTHS